MSLVKFCDLLEQLVSLPRCKLDVLQVFTAGTMLQWIVVSEVRLHGVRTEESKGKE